MVYPPPFTRLVANFTNFRPCHYTSLHAAIEFCNYDNDSDHGGNHVILHLAYQIAAAHIYTQIMSAVPDSITLD